MKTKYLLLAMTTLMLASCTHKQKAYNFEKIEIVEYRWINSTQYSEGNNIMELWCKFFTTIDSNGVCKVVENYYGKTQFKTFQIPDTLLVNLLNRLSSLKTDISLHPKQPILYEGPQVRLIYYSRGSKRIVDFSEASGYSDETCMSIYHYIKKLNTLPEFVTSSDTTETKDLRMKQLEILYDTSIMSSKNPDNIRFIK